MDEYEESYSRIEKITNATQCMKECLVCRICLELFKEPVTIKCGHKFCRSCILKVASNENAFCPFCNIKLQKRSIPKVGNELLQSVVELFSNLTAAISSDSGIDALKPYNKLKDTNESASISNRSNIQKFENVPTTSKNSFANTKLLKERVNSEKIKKCKSRKKGVVSVETLDNKNNGLKKYTCIDSDFESNEEVHSEEKVKSWLKHISQDVNNINSDERSCEDINSNIQKSNEDPAITDNSPISHLKVNHQSCLSDNSKLNNLKFNSTKHADLEQEKTNETIQIKLDKLEMMTQNKKQNITSTDKVILKTPSSKQSSSNRDANNWRRVKQVGKEMQAKTFKSLNVSIEKNSLSIALDDTLPCNSTSNDSKNISREFDTNNHSSNDIGRIKSKSLKVNSAEEKENSRNINGNCRKKNNSIDLTNSDKEENNSVSYIDENKIQEIIGIEYFQNNLNTPEITRNIPNTSNLEFLTKLNHLTPLKIKSDNSNKNNQISDNESTDYDDRTTVFNSQNSVSKYKSFAEKKLTTSINSKLNHYPEKTQIRNKSSRNFSPEKQKNKISLQLPSIKNNECFSNKNKFPIENYTNCNDSAQSNRSIISFTKLGKMCRKRKNISFVFLGSLKPKKRIISCSPTKEKPSGLIIKSNVPTNFDVNILKANANRKLNSTDIVKINHEKPAKSSIQEEIKMLSPEQDSQLKFLSIDSPNYRSKKNIDINVNENRSMPTICKAKKSNIPMEIDEPIPSVSNTSKHHVNVKEKETQEDKFSKTNKQLLGKSINCHIESSNLDKEILEIDLKIKEKYEKSDESDSDEISSPIKRKNNKLQKKRAMCIDSEETEYNSTKSHDIHVVVENKAADLDKNTERNSEIEINSDSQSSGSSKVNVEQDFEKIISISTGTSNSPLISPIKKKRTHSESSNDDDVSSIIGKWCGTVNEPTIKKQKTVLDNGSDLILNQKKNKSNNLKCFISDDNDNTLINSVVKASKLNKQHEDPPVNKIVHKAKNNKENAIHTNKIADTPSSILSDDLFESNHINPTPFKQSNKITDNNFTVGNLSPQKISNKEYLSPSSILSNCTIIDLKQFHENKLNLSGISESSNKENIMCNQIHVNNVSKDKIDNVEDREDEIKNSQNDKSTAIKDDFVISQFNTCHVSDTLINITQEEIALKKIEKALIGVNLSEIQHDQIPEIYDSNKFSTPRRKIKNQISNKSNDDYDYDSIDGTPVSKKRQLFQFQTPKSMSKLERNKSNIISPQNNLNLIPAVTPMKNTRSYPLSHSTPMVNTLNLKNRNCNKTKCMTLICSGLIPENIKIVQIFADKFGAKFQNNFNMEVTHVIVQTNLETKAGQKTFKYIQGIAFKKYVINFQWIVDCLKQNSILNEDEEKYEVLDPDNFESGSKKSRTKAQDLFERFAFYCQGPFSSFPLNEFKNILIYNGGIVCPSIKTLSLQKEKYKIVILESETLSQSETTALKKSKGALISFEWIVDSISQYQILSLWSYLCEMTVEEALALGFPPEYLVEEETLEEKETEEQEEQEDEEEGELQ